MIPDPEEQVSAAADRLRDYVIPVASPALSFAILAVGQYLGQDWLTQQLDLGPNEPLLGVVLLIGNISISSIVGHVAANVRLRRNTASQIDAIGKKSDQYLRDKLDGIISELLSASEIRNAHGKNETLPDILSALSKFVDKSGKLKEPVKGIANNAALAHVKGLPLLVDDNEKGLTMPGREATDIYERFLHHYSAINREDTFKFEVFEPYPVDPDLHFSVAYLKLLKGITDNFPKAELHYYVVCHKNVLLRGTQKQIEQDRASRAHRGVTALRALKQKVAEAGADLYWIDTASVVEVTRITDFQNQAHLVFDGESACSVHPDTETFKDGQLWMTLRELTVDDTFKQWYRECTNETATIEITDTAIGDLELEANNNRKMRLKLDQARAND